jgi:hypothetical protein
VQYLQDLLRKKSTGKVYTSQDTKLLAILAKQRQGQVPPPPPSGPLVNLQLAITHMPEATPELKALMKPCQPGTNSSKLKMDQWLLLKHMQPCALNCAPKETPMAPGHSSSSATLEGTKSTSFLVSFNAQLASQKCHLTPRLPRGPTLQF